MHLNESLQVKFLQVMKVCVSLWPEIDVFEVEDGGIHT